MPHIIVKLWTGKPEDKKRQLAEEIKKLTINILGTPESSISVAFEETTPEDWPLKVYGPDIMDKQDTLYIKPGYVPDIFKK
ncbi:MAG: 4-oxalocrotonate tautomerase [Fusobacteria bacterium]|nr:MAG: 4-oxalocrotonate tautomerase [Fusobacteriota bacterium]KAF0229193.1 MAG: 4-oxalocrotonate [Fusobacteriota bacterium]